MSKNFSAKDGDGNLVSGGMVNFDGSVVVAVDGSLTPIATDFTASDPTANTAGASNSLYSTPYLLRWIVKGLQAIFGRLPAQLDANGNLKTAAQGLVITTCTRSGAAVTSTSSVVLAANANRKSAIFSNAGTIDIYLSRGPTAAGGQGSLLKPGGSFEITPSLLYAGVLSAITVSGTSSLAIEEGV